MTPDLPAAALGDLHILPIWLVRGLLLAPFVALLLAFLWWLVRRFFRSNPEPAPASPRKPQEGRKPDFALALDGLLAPFFESGNIRGGLHELAKAIRNRLEQLEGEQVEVLTVDEILPATDVPVDDLLIELRTRQFSKNPPHANQLRRLAESAGQLLAAKK